MKVIAFSGWKESGKDMCADYLGVSLGAKKLSFADPLKVIVAEQYGVPLEHMYDQKYKEKAIVTMPVSPRDGFSEKIAEMLKKEFRCSDGRQYDDFYLNKDEQQLYGHDRAEQTSHPLYWTPRALCILEGSIKRSADPSYWVSRAVNKADKDGTYLIADLRYKNEANTLIKLREEGKIEKLVLIRLNRWEKSPSDDPSERDLDDYELFDAHIHNKDSEKVLKIEVFQQLEGVLKKVNF